MKLNEHNVQSLLKHFETEQARLDKELETNHISSSHKEILTTRKDDVVARLSTLSRIILRHSLQLDIQRKVFVSTRLERGSKPPDWITHILGRVNELRQLAGRQEFQWLFGIAGPGGDFNQAILEKLVDCSCFLVIVSAKPNGNHKVADVSRFVLEEVGAAYALGKPIIRATEETINQHVIGHLFGTQWQSVSFRRGQAEEKDFALRLKQGLEDAPAQQLHDVQKRRRIVNRLFE